MSTLDKAIEIAARAHAGQREKGGQPYVFHPLRVMMRVQSNEGRIVAALHDVVEDTDVTIEDLRKAGFSERVLAAVDRLTKRPGEEWETYLARVKQSKLAIEVKLSDLWDNADPKRLTGIPATARERLGKYRAGWRYLTGRDMPPRK